MNFHAGYDVYSSRPTFEHLEMLEMSSTSGIHGNGAMIVGGVDGCIYTLKSFIKYGGYRLRKAAEKHFLKKIVTIKIRSLTFA